MMYFFGANMAKVETSLQVKLGNQVDHYTNPAQLQAI